MKSSILLHAGIITVVYGVGFAGVALTIPISLFIWGIFTGATTPYAVGVLILIGILGWGVWNAIDWSNDYYIVTNQRVIWLEKVVGLYDSRRKPRWVPSCLWALKQI